jgi:hypothetical protein
MSRIHHLSSVLRAGLDWMVRSPWRSFLVLFLLSFVIRYNQLDHIPYRYLLPHADRELGAIVLSLMETGRFADPYRIPTGPTAHLPPLYPFLLSLIYRWLGLTHTAAYVVFLFTIMTSSWLYAMLPWFSDRLGLGRQAGFIAGLAGALLVEPEWPSHGEILTGIILGLLLIAFLGRWTKDRASWRGSLFLGLGMGAAFYLQPALLPVMLGCMAFELWWRRSRRALALLSVMALGIVLACAPWTWRNYTTFHALFFIRSNLGLELRMGNHDRAAAAMEVMDAHLVHRHPTLLESEARIVQEVGEIEYMRQAGQEALEWILAHPAEFLRLTMERIANLWMGPLHRPLAAAGVSALTFLAFLGAWRAFPGLSAPQRAALLVPLSTYPIIYYFVAYMPRYRMPIDWLLFILAGAAVWNWISGLACEEAEDGSQSSKIEQKPLKSSAPSKGAQCHS